MGDKGSKKVKPLLVDLANMATLGLASIRNTLEERGFKHEKITGDTVTDRAGGRVYAKYLFLQEIHILFAMHIGMWTRPAIIQWR